VPNASSMNRQIKESTKQSMGGRSNLGGGRSTSITTTTPDRSTQSSRHRLTFGAPRARNSFLSFPPVRSFDGFKSLKYEQKMSISRVQRNELQRNELGRMRTEGFTNLGNTCYLNAVVQALVSLPLFVRDLQYVGWLEAAVNQGTKPIAHGGTKPIAHGGIGIGSGLVDLAAEDDRASCSAGSTDLSQHSTRSTEQRAAERAGDPPLGAPPLEAPFYRSLVTVLEQVHKRSTATAYAHSGGAIDLALLKKAITSTQSGARFAGNAQQVYHHYAHSLHSLHSPTPLPPSTHSLPSLHTLTPSTPSLHSLPLLTPSTHSLHTLTPILRMRTSFLETLYVNCMRRWRRWCWGCIRRIVVEERRWTD
jgi:hypothetical protein